MVPTPVVETSGIERGVLSWLHVPDRIARLEQPYGPPRTGGILPRLKALELMVIGEESTGGALPARITALVEKLHGHGLS